MIVNGFDIIGDWEVSNIGFTAVATKGGKKYFLKKYGEYKMPRNDESTTPAFYRKLEASFNDFKNYRVAINKELLTMSGPGGNILVPNQWFVDDIYYIEVTDFIENVVKDADILRLPYEDRLFIMLTAAGSLFGIHRKNIVHSDLKRSNILVSKNTYDKYVAKVFDFDRSYFANDIRPDYIGGDQNFMSPEFARCLMCDMADEALQSLSTKSDIFSLGLVFHDFLADGDHPSIKGLTGRLKERADKGKTVYCSEALLAGAQLVISDRIREKHLVNLLVAMLQPEPEDRPTAQEVLEVLKTNRILPVKPDSQILSRYSMSEPEPVTIPSSDSAKRETVPAGFSEPWADHNVVFDTAKITEMGYSALERFSQGTSKVYRLHKAKGGSRVFNVEMLVLLGLAKKTDRRAGTPRPEPHESPVPTPESDDGRPWEEGFVYNPDAVHKMGYESIVKVERSGSKLYLLTKSNGDKRFMSFVQAKMLGFISGKTD